MANINMTFQEIRDQATRLDTGRQELQDKLNALKGEVDQLISSGFQTDASSGAFGDTYNQFTQGAAATIDGLQGMTSFLNMTAQSMQDLDSQLASAIRS